jgi:hypothetical protein
MSNSINISKANRNNVSTNIFFTNAEPIKPSRITKDFNKSNIFLEKYHEDVSNNIKKKPNSEFQPNFTEETPYSRRLKQFYSSSVDYPNRYTLTSYGAINNEEVLYYFI